MNRTIKSIIPTIAILVLTLGTTGAYAYYTAQTETTQNAFNIVAGGGTTGINGGTLGTVEESFDPNTAKDLEPRDTFDKKAKLVSNVEYSSYAYLCVTVPNVNARLSGDTAKSYRDAVTLDFDTLNWTLVKKTEGSGSKPTKYLYRYQTILPSGGKTTDLFKKATVPDFVESEGVSGSIDVTGYMLSSVNVTTTEADGSAIANFFS